MYLKIMEKIFMFLIAILKKVLPKQLEIQIKKITVGTYRSISAFRQNY